MRPVAVAYKMCVCVCVCVCYVRARFPPENQPHPTPGQHDSRAPERDAIMRRLTKGKGSPYSITERRVPELIPVLGSQPAGGVSHKPGGRGCYHFPPGLQLLPQPLRGLLPILLLGKQRHDGCEQFA